MKKEENLKEKFRQALTSTIKVISDDYKPTFDKKNKVLKESNFFELDNLNNKSDFIRFRAEADSEALKKKFSNTNIKVENKALGSISGQKVILNQMRESSSSTINQIDENSKYFRSY